MSNAVIFDINKCSFVDGPGIRTTFYFKGCNLRCKWCHNPESWEAKPQLLFYKDKCLHCGLCEDACEYGAINDPKKCVVCGKCAKRCPHRVRIRKGKEYDLASLVKLALEDKAFYGDDGGVTCSGGECLLQIDFVEQFLMALKKEGIHTAIDTACNVPLSYLKRIVDYTDIFLVDVKAFTSNIHEEFTGASNELILNNIRYLSDNNARMWIRIPVVKECNGTIEEMRKIAEFVNKLKVERVELMAYHSFGINKARAIGYDMQKFSKVTEEDIEQFKQLFRKEIVI